MRFLLTQGPWGPANQGEKKEDANKNQDSSKKKENDFLKNLFSQEEKKSGGSNGGDGGGSKNDNNFFDQFNKSPKKMAGLLVLGVVGLWLLSGFFKIDSDENGVVLYFGKFYKIVTPGLNYRIPYPFSTLIKQSVTRVNSEEFGYNSSIGSAKSRNLQAESLMLTGDENIVDM